MIYVTHFVDNVGAKTTPTGNAIERRASSARIGNIVESTPSDDGFAIFTFDR